MLRTEVSPLVAPAAQGARGPARHRGAASAVWAIGTALPGAGLAQADLVAFMKEAHRADSRLGRRLDVLYRRSGIERRHTCLADYGREPQNFTFYPRHWTAGPMPSTARRMDIYAEAARPLARSAAGAALARLPALPAVTHLIVTSCTGFYSPGLDTELATDLGLSPAVTRTLIGFQGCHAGISSLRLADAIVSGDPQAVVLVVCVELCTLHFQIEPSDDNLLANSLFADGACAVVVAADRDATSGAGSGWRRGPRLTIERGGSWLAAGTGREMAWTIGDEGFHMRLSALVPRLLGANVRGFLEQALRVDAAVLADLSFWAVHPGGPSILDHVERALGLEPEQLAASRSVLRHHGNMSSPTVIFVLEQIWREMCESRANGAGTGARGIAIAFGPGLTLEAVLLAARV